MHKRRAIDRILDPGYLDDVDTLTTEQLRARRDECEEHESGVSYARRVLQGKLDIVRAEVERRRNGQDGDVVLVDLSDVLADRGLRGPGAGRVSRFMVPPAVPHHRRWLDQVVDDEVLAQLHERSDGDLRALADGLLDREQEVSRMRRQLLDRIDRLQAALSARYAEDGVDVAGILARRL